VANTRNDYFHDLIFDAMEKLNSIDKRMKVLEYIDINQIPFCYVNVENETIGEYSTESSNQFLDVDCICQFRIVLFFDVKQSKNSSKDSIKEGNKWIEWIEYFLKDISLPDYYTHTMNDADYYEVCVNSIKIDKNLRSDVLGNDLACALEVQGQIEYNKNYL